MLHHVLMYPHTQSPHEVHCSPHNWTWIGSPVLIYTSSLPPPKKTTTIGPVQWSWCVDFPVPTTRTPRRSDDSATRASLISNRPGLFFVPPHDEVEPLHPSTRLIPLGSRPHRSIPQFPTSSVAPRKEYSQQKERRRIKKPVGRMFCLMASSSTRLLQRPFSTHIWDNWI